MSRTRNASRVQQWHQTCVGWSGTLSTTTLLKYNNRQLLDDANIHLLIKAFGSNLYCLFSIKRSFKNVFSYIVSKNEVLYPRCFGWCMFSICGRVCCTPTLTRGCLNSLQLLSPRTTCETKSKSLQVLEQQLALACFSTSQENDTGARASFLALQHTFECNSKWSYEYYLSPDGLIDGSRLTVPARLLPWVTQATARLEHLTNKGTVERKCFIYLSCRPGLCMQLSAIDEKVSEVGELTSLLATALSLLQGTCLIHEPTKHYLGRKASLEVNPPINAPGL